MQNGARCFDWLAADPGCTNRSVNGVPQEFRRQAANPRIVPIEVGRCCVRRSANAADAPFSLSPKRFTELARILRKHAVEAQANTNTLAGVHIDGVLQPGRKEQYGTVGHCNERLICVRRHKFSDWRTNDCGLDARVVEINRVGAALSLNIVNTT